MLFPIHQKVMLNRLCNDCQMSLVPWQDENGKCFWWCTACNTKTKRVTLIKKLQKFCSEVFNPGFTSLLCVLVVVGGLSLFISSMLDKEAKAPPQNYVVILGTQFVAEHGRNSCDSAYYLFYRQAVREGSPIKKIKEDKELQILYVKTKPHVLNAADSDYPQIHIFQDSRLATQYDLDR